MRELDRRVGILRLLLADIADRERQAEDARKQLRGQIQRIVDFTVQFNGGVSNALAGMAEVEDRLTRQDAALRHLALLRERARAELHAVLVTGEVADSRRRLAELEAQRTRLVADASDSVAQATGRPPCRCNATEPSRRPARPASFEDYGGGVPHWGLRPPHSSVRSQKRRRLQTARKESPSPWSWGGGSETKDGTREGMS